jgi:amino-acid N-acetyltransferase
MIGMLPMKAHIERAHAGDASHVLRLLEENQLTTDGLLDHLATILVARLDHRIVGTAALEIYSDAALLRSVAVSSDVRGRGVGAVLVESALHVAEEQRMHDVYLLTFTAETYFLRFGFQLLDRSDVPAAVRTSVQFTHACPSTASVMRKRLRPPIEPPVEDEQ